VVIEAGPTFFDGAVKQVGQGIESITAELQKRDSTPYASLKMNDAPRFTHLRADRRPRNGCGPATHTSAEIPLTPSGYKMLRFDEDYSYLTNQANRTDLFDQVKYIPLRQDDRCGMRHWGELRERYEGHYDPNFGIGGKGSDSYLLQRITF